MSGTLGISPIRQVSVVGVCGVARSFRWRMEKVYRRGGLTPAIAVPVAVALTTAVVWVTVAGASSWVSA